MCLILISSSKNLGGWFLLDDVFVLLDISKKTRENYLALSSRSAKLNPKEL